MQAQLPTATALGSLWLLLILLPSGTEAAPTIPTKTAIIILAAIAAVYFIVCALCILIIILWIVCRGVFLNAICSSRKRTRCKVCPASNSQYAPRGRDNELKKPPRHGEPRPKKTPRLTPKDGIAVRSISQEYLRKDGGVVTYTATAQTVTIAEKPSPLVVPCPVRPSPLLVAQQKPAASKLDNVTVIENPWWEEGSSSSGGSRSDEVFEKQPPPSEPISSGTIEDRREEVRSSRGKKGRTDSTRPLLNGSESRGPSESGEPDAIPLPHISYGQQAVTQVPPDYAYPKHEPPRRKKPSLDRTDSTKPLLTRSDSSEPATPTDPTPVAHNTLRAMTQDPRDYEHSKRPKHKFAGVPRKALSSGRISVDVVVTNQWYASDLPDTREEGEEDGHKEEEEDAEGREEEEDAEGHETML